MKTDEYFPLRYDLDPMKPIEWPHDHFGGNTFVFYQYDYIPKSVCEQMIQYMEESGRLVPSETRGVVDEVSRPNSFAMMGGKPAQPLYDLMYDFGKEFFETLNILPGHGTDGVKLHKTIPDGYFNWHADEGISHYKTPRQFTTLAYLNSEFEGGHTEFLLQQLDIKPETGLIIFYPSNMSHIHRGTPVTSGTKYLASMWASEIAPLWS